MSVRLQNDLVNVETSISKNHLISNIGKTNCLLVGSRKKVSSNGVLNLQMNHATNEQLSCMDLHLLGLKVDEIR